MSDPPVEEVRAPRVTVLLATFEGADHLEEQLESLLAQVGLDLRIVVSDDGSRDATPGLLADWARRDARIQLLPPRRSGSAAANFYRLIRDAPLAEADFVAFSDQDDLWPPEKLRRAVQRLEETGAHGYSADVVAFYPDGTERPIVKSQPQRRWDHLFSSAGPGCTYVVRVAPLRELADRLAAVPEAVARVEFHDWLVYAWFRQRGLRWVIDPEPAMRYRQHGRNVLGANAGMAAAASRAWQTVRGGPFRQVEALAAVIGAEHDLPLVLLRSGSRRDLLRLALAARELRRSTPAGLGLAAILVARAALPRRLLRSP